VIWSRLNDLRAGGMTLILTTHYMEEAERLCDRLVIMDRGQVLDEDSPRELVNRHVEPEVVEIRGGPSAEMPAIPASENCRLERMGSSLYCYTRDPTPLLTRLRQTPGLTFLHRPTGLEDVFLKLTGRELRD
jgi:lipooligosaccharide transport system ATP-binding protein